MSAVVFEGVSVVAGAKTILGPIALAIEPHSWTAIVGPSGSGKTTLLRVIAGLAPPSSGRVSLFGALVQDGRKLVVQPEKRGVGFVFQGGGAGLWPHMSVRKTLDFTLSCAGVTKPDRGARIDALLEAVQLGSCAAQKPGELSGGEAQRLSLARALATRPRLLLLDEPLGPLDRELRGELVERLREFRRSFDLTILHVTHDPDEVAHLVDRTLRLESGRIVASDSASG